MITISFLEIKQKHKILCPEVSLDFFMEQYCNQLSDEKFKRVEVIVSSELKFVFDTSA